MLSPVWAYRFKGVISDRNGAAGICAPGEKPMDDATTAHIKTLAAEYVELVDMMRGGQYADDEEYRQLSSQRTLIHDELIRLTGVTERKAMYGHCRALLAGEIGQAPTEG